MSFQLQNPYRWYPLRVQPILQALQTGQKTDLKTAHLGVLNTAQLLPDGQSICHDLHCQRTCVMSDSLELGQSASKQSQGLHALRNTIAGVPSFTQVHLGLPTEA